MNFIGQRKAGASTPAIAEIASDPNGPYIMIERGFEEGFEIFPASARGVGAVEHVAALGIGIEDSGEMHLRECCDELARRQSVSLQRSESGSPCQSGGAPGVSSAETERLGSPAESLP